MVLAVTPPTPSNDPASSRAAADLALRAPSFRDLIALTKPRITFIVLVTSSAGMQLARAGRHLPWMTWVWTMLGTGLVVAAANTLNMYMERDVDGLMARTAERPLPTGRMAPAHALLFGLMLAALSLPILAMGVGSLTGLLGAIALVSYVLIYTPMKRRSTWALWVGAVPGAIPPLLGWTAVTHRLDAAGLALFTMLFVWQVPHFLAISLFRAGEYDRAGLKVVPIEQGERAAKWMLVRYAMLMLLASLWPAHEGLGGRVYVVVALALGALFIAMGVAGLRRMMDGARSERWAKRVFAYSIVYLVCLFAALVATSA
ncbi:MAG: heme o synthase [Polyangiales bacterium]